MFWIVLGLKNSWKSLNLIPLIILRVRLGGNSLVNSSVYLNKEFANKNLIKIKFKIEKSGEIYYKIFYLGRKNRIFCSWVKNETTQKKISYTIAQHIGL